MTKAVVQPAQEQLDGNTHRRLDGEDAADWDGGVFLPVAHADHDEGGPEEGDGAARKGEHVHARLADAESHGEDHHRQRHHDVLRGEGADPVHQQATDETGRCEGGVEARVEPGALLGGIEVENVLEVETAPCAGGALSGGHEHEDQRLEPHHGRD